MSPMRLCQQGDLRDHETCAPVKKQSMIFGFDTSLNTPVEYR